MKKVLVLMIVVGSFVFSYVMISQHLTDSQKAPLANARGSDFLKQDRIDNDSASANTLHNPPIRPKQPINTIDNMLRQKELALNPDVINKVLTILDCTQAFHIEYNPILTVIDYSLPANQKRLWVFDLNKKELLFHTYVSHGIKSGALLSNYFSNKYDSKTSSIGVYTTEKSYYGREGLSLKLNGLEKGFNDHAYNRSLVMHGGWYLDEEFIKKYGRSGRSWGCPAVPEEFAEPIINHIKDNTLLVVYYPEERWLSTSKFLQCHNTSSIASTATEAKLPIPAHETRDDVLWVDKAQNKEGAVVAIPADTYAQLFQTSAPLARMLRRPIDHMEYIALNNLEFETIMLDNTKLNKHICFVKPVITMRRGYYATEMKLIHLGQIKRVRLNTLASNSSTPSYTVYLNSEKSIQIKSTNHFIRWLGL